MKVIVGVVALIGAVCADAQSAWVPDATCESRIKLCYESDKATLVMMKQVDVLNPCRLNSTIVKGTCSDNGFSKYLMQDPVFKKAAVYMKPIGQDFESMDVMTSFSDLFAKGLRGSHDQDACWVNAEYRGIGKVRRECQKDEERQLGLCFKKCEKGMEGFGAVCWDGCPSSHPVKAGVICCESEDACNDYIKGSGVKLAFDIQKIIADEGDMQKLVGDFQKLITDASDLKIPHCTN